MNPSKIEFKIGCSGWSYPEWKGIFYPETLPKKDYFTYYTSNFDTVEINNTFYRFPSLDTVHDWYNKAPAGFIYSLKASNYITHMKRFNNVNEALEKLYSLSDILKEKMGCFLFQLPSNFVFKDENLKKIVNSLNPKYKNVVEFRNKSWWKAEVYEAFREHKIMFCGTNGFGMPNVFHAANGEAYVRFHGNQAYNKKYSNRELREWADKIVEMRPKRVWVYYNNTANGYACENALEFIKISKAVTGREEIECLENSKKISKQSKKIKKK